MRPSISSQHSRPPHYLSSARQEDELLLREWLLVLKGDGESPRTIENYRGSVGMLVGFLAAGGSPCSCSDANGNLRDSSRTPTTQCPGDGVLDGRAGGSRSVLDWRGDERFAWCAATRRFEG